MIKLDHLLTLAQLLSYLRYLKRSRVGILLCTYS